MDESTYRKDKSIKDNIILWLEDNWPSIYRGINNALFSIWQFIADTIRGLWPGR